jgi:hypothetical protein
MVNRRLVRFLSCAGLESTAVEDPKDLDAHVDHAHLLCADAFDGDVVVQAIQRNPSLRAILWTAEPLDRCLRYMTEHPQISNILGRANFESTPRDWELAMVLRRLSRPNDGMPPFSAFLNWGFTGFQERISGTAARDDTVIKVQRFVDGLGVPRRVTGVFGELAHEMLMNAIFDAPVDAAGRPKYALDRKATVVLDEAEQPSLRLAADGKHIVIQVEDPFGRLERKHVFAGLARGLKGGEMDHSHGGAGLGMVVCYNSTTMMVYDVVRGEKTEVTGVYDLDMNLREFRTQGKSLHFFMA